MIKDIKGQKFNRLTVIKRVENDRFGNAQWLCECECGNKTITLGTHLRSNHTKSCGCKQMESIYLVNHKPKHNMINTRIYKIWNGMKNRTNENSTLKYTEYKNYSGRGIKVCDEWKNSFIKFYKWALENGYNDKLSIDRIDVNGNYEPNNCRWVTNKEQQNNKRSNVFLNFNNERHTISQWNEILNLPKGIIKNRLSRGWSIERALTTEVKR